MKLFWKSFRVALLLQVALSILFIIGSIVNGKKDLMDNFDYGVYFSYLFLQFFPVLFLAVLLIRWLLRLWKRRKGSEL